MKKWFATQLWNMSEFYGFRCPFAPTIFGWMIGSAGRRLK